MAALGRLLEQAWSDRYRRPRGDQNAGAAARTCDHMIGSHGTSDANFRVYCCRVDRDRTASSLCQAVRALQVDDFVARILLDALAPGQVAIAIEAVGRLGGEARQLQQQWSLRRERTRYEAERACRQYNEVEPENRLVARSLEKAWEERLRAAAAVEQEYRQWAQQEPTVLTSLDREALEALASDLRSIWNAPTTKAE
jgi:hypothetical protein